MAGQTRERKRIRLVGVAVIGVALCLALTACVPFPIPFGGPRPQPTTTPTGERVSPELQPYYSQDLVWERCGDGAFCATAKAPLDWDDPDPSKDIELALVRIPATKQRYGVLFTDPGGPGGSGVSFVRDDPASVVSGDVREHYDLVGWDPRGVGESSAVSCGSDAALDEYFFGRMDAELNTPEGDAELIAEAKAFAAACKAGTGELLDHIDTESTTRDLDMLRAAMGDTRMNYLGYSYGSDIGALYAELFPAKVGRMVLDGATDSTAGLFETGLEQIKGFRGALEAYLDDCGRRSACFFEGGAREGIAYLQALFDRLDENPVMTTDGRPIDSTFLYSAIQTGLYSQDTWSYITDAITEIGEGDPSTTTLLTDFSFSRDELGNYTDNGRIAFIAIMCIDYPVTTDPAEIARENELVAEVSPFRLEQSRLGDVQCQNWPYPGHARRPVLHGAGAAPILVVATTGDPATPYDWGVALAEQLETAHLITYVGEGHIAYDEGDPCVTRAVDRYLLTGELPPDGLTCGGSST